MKYTRKEVSLMVDRVFRSSMPAVYEQVFQVGYFDDGVPTDSWFNNTHNCINECHENSSLSSEIFSKCRKSRIELLIKSGRVIMPTHTCMFVVRAENLPTQIHNMCNILQLVDDEYLIWFDVEAFANVMGINKNAD